MGTLVLWEKLSQRGSNGMTGFTVIENAIMEQPSYSMVE